MGTNASPRTGARSDRPGKLLPTPGNTASQLRRMRRNDSVATLAHPPARDSRRAADGDAARQHVAAAAADGAETLEQCVRRSLDQYFVALDGAKPHALHELVVQAVERPLLQFVMEKSGGNQSAAALLLGINRNTLRKKLSDYGFGLAGA